MISEFFIVLNLFRFLVERNWCHLFAFAWNFFFIWKTYISANIWSIYDKSISDRENFIILDNYYINVVGVGDVDGVCSWSGFSCVSDCSNFVGFNSKPLFENYWSCHLNVCFNKEFNCWSFDFILLPREQQLNQWVDHKNF